MLQFYFKTRDAWDAMYQDCLVARSSISFEQYIICDDEVGARFLDLFAEKARQGIAVRLLLDRVGCREIFANPAIEEIVKNGGQVLFYNPVGWLNLFMPRTWFPRNHVKTMLIDSEIAYVGGVCLADYMHDWQDMHARLTGEPAREVAEDFARIWQRVIVGRRRHRETGKKFWYCVRKPALPRNEIYEELLAAISKAQKSVYIATPYFLPPRRLRHALLEAAQRQVDVRVMATEQSDVPFAVYVSSSYFPGFVRGGVRLFLYKKTVLHAKYVTVDDDWAMLGSTNIDYLSLLRNREANLLIREAGTVMAMKDHFLSDLKDCMELQADFLRGKPWHTRVIGYAGRCLKKVI